jgi:hypothetical protein
LNGAWPGRFLPALRRSWRLRGAIGIASGSVPGSAGAFDSAAGSAAAFGKARGEGFAIAFDVLDALADFGAVAFDWACDAAGLAFDGVLGVSSSLIDSLRKPRG